MIIFLWIIFTTSLLIIILSILMSPDSNSFSGALVGSSDLELFKISKERGSKLYKKYLMFFLGFCLIIFSVVIRIYL